MVSDLDQAREALLHFSPPRRLDHDPIVALNRLLDLLGRPQRGYQVIQVAGTSGKTSTAYLVRGLLEAAGRRTGLTVSPHIVAVNERVQVGGQPLPEQSFCRYVTDFLRLARPLADDLTYFELTVALALWVFAQEQVTDAVVEVGIGGLRDATNALQSASKLCLVSAVGLDHTEILGSNVAEIAAQKAGIVGPGNTVVVVDQDEQVLQVVRDRADAVGARMLVAGYPAGANFQARNEALARAAVGVLAARDGFPVPELTPPDAPPARFEQFTVGGHRLVLDGAHNPQKMAGLVQALAEAGYGPLAAVATLVEAPVEKLDQTLAVLAPSLSFLIVPDYELGSGDKVKRSFPAAVVAAAARRVGIVAEVAPSIDAAWARLLARREPDLLVTGSLYLAAMVRPYLTGSGEIGS